MDNLDPATGNPDPATPGVEGAGHPEPSAPVDPLSTAPSFESEGWKNSLKSDLRDSPLVKKFDDNIDGLNKALESHLNLEKMLGHDKVPVPKGPEDVEGWNRFSKAMGIPDAAEGYGLPDAQLPDSMKGITIDKAKFAEVVHAHKLTPAQAKGLWETYQSINIDTYQKAMQSHQDRMNQTVNELKSQWGDAYETNVELGQAVINKFSEDQEMNDYLTAQLSQDPKGIKFLAKIGGQFAEHKIPEFSMKRFSLAPEEAQEEIDKMTQDLDGPYMNVSNKYSPREHQAAIDRVNSLREAINRSKR